MTDIRLIPPGYRYLMICAALTKRALLAPNLPPAEKLDLLENLNALSDSVFTPAMLVAIEPMTNVEIQMYEAAAGLDGRDDERCTASFDVLTRNAFAHFAHLSLAPAIELMGLREGNKCLPT